MKNRMLLAALVPLLAMPALAHADAEKDKNDAMSVIAGANRSAKGFEQNALDTSNYFDTTLEQCNAAIAKLAALGVAKTETVWGGDRFPLKDAPAQCERYAKARAAHGAVAPIRLAKEQGDRLKTVDPKSPSETGASAYIATVGKDCVTAVDAAIAGGAVADRELNLGSFGNLSLNGARAMCEQLVKDATALAGAADAANADRSKAAREKYTKFGAAGDKLEWLLQYDPDGAGKIWYLPPKCEATDDAERLAKAKVLIRWGVNDDGTQVLRKLTFKGNKKVKDQEKTFPTEAKAYKFCK